SFSLFSCCATPPSHPSPPSLHDALPISAGDHEAAEHPGEVAPERLLLGLAPRQQRSDAHQQQHEQPQGQRDLVEEGRPDRDAVRSEEHTSELQSRENLVCRLLLEKKNTA